MITAAKVLTNGLAIRHISLFKAIYPDGLEVTNDNIIEMALFGIGVYPMAKALLDKDEFNLFSRCTAPTRAWYRRFLARAEDKVAACKEVQPTLIAVEAAMFVRIYRKAYKVD